MGRDVRSDLDNIMTRDEVKLRSVMCFMFGVSDYVDLVMSICKMDFEN